MKTLSRNLLTFALVVLLVQLPLVGAGTPLGKVVPRAGSSLLNGADLTVETTVFFGDRVATEADGVALILVPQGQQVQLAPSSSATLSGKGGQLLVNLESGTTLVQSGNSGRLSVAARGLMVRPSGMANYQVIIEGSFVTVSSQQGSVEVRGANRSLVVPSGKAMKFELAANPEAGRVGVGAHNVFGAAAAVIISTAVSLAIAVPIAVVVANNRADDARIAGCKQGIQAISPGAPTAACK